MPTGVLYLKMCESFGKIRSSVNFMRTIRDAQFFSRLRVAGACCLG
jgi:hypothetical protein